MAVAELGASAKGREFLGAILEDADVEAVAMTGSRFNGKTFYNCLAAVLCCLKWPDVRVLMLRREIKVAEANLGEEIENIHNLLGMRGEAVTKSIVRNRYIYPNGSYIQLGYCRLDTDWEVYKGLQFEFIFFEEATLFKEHQIDGLRGSCRVRRAQPGLRAKKVFTTNPDGIGMGWVKRRIVDPRTRDSGLKVIHCTVYDSPPTMERDPGYVLRELRKLPDWQRRQWELGDWDAQAGQFWSMQPKVFQKVEIPEWAEIFAGLDDGFSDAFSVVWAAKWKDFEAGKPRIHVFRDLKRTRMNLREKVEAVFEIEKSFDRPVKARWGDPNALWKRRESDSGLSSTTAHFWAQLGMVVSQAFSNTRVAGWNLKRTLMDDGVLTIDPNGAPSLYSEMAAAVHARGSEDMHGDCEDHCSDAERYLLVSVFSGGYRVKSRGTRESRRARVQRLARGAYATA